MILVFSFVFGSYFLYLIFLIIGFRRLSPSHTQFLPKTRFSIVIPFRNEAAHLPDLLTSISKLNYPESHFEVLLVNDNSEDISEKIVLDFISKSILNMQLFQNIRKSDAPKKDALTTGISHAKNEWIVTTDADCFIPQNWLLNYDAIIQQKNPKMVCGPVIYCSSGKTLEDFQQLDGLSLQTVTGGSFGLNNPVLANGANLSFEKKEFYSVNGFDGNNHLASGDDIFLMEKFKRQFPGRVVFLKSKEATVRTRPQKSFQLLINQRVRWLSKTSKQKNIFSIIPGLLVLSVNLAVLFTPVLMIIHPHFSLFYLGLMVIKLFLDFIFILQTSHFHQIKIRFRSFLISFLLYPVIVTVVAIISFRGKFHWKGRTYENQK